jgi:hypothetical protein
VKVDSFVCDACGQAKGQTNHWHKFTAHPDQFSVTDWHGSDYTNTLHLCSDSCVVKTVQGWLSKQKEVSQRGE